MTRKDQLDKLSKSQFILSKKRYFDNQKSNDKLRALQLWGRGESITDIAIELQKSRSTVYAWISKAEKSFSQKRSGSRLQVDRTQKSRILELYVLLKRPSIRKLREALKFHFHIEYSEPQLRRYLRQWGFDCFRPSPLYERIRSQAVTKILAETRSDEGSSRESDPKWIERFLPSSDANPPSE